ncbi:dTDP-4-dehydrorhamnose reductase/UDP-glucose 4-epimerase [Rhodobium orientis]|uniref:NAD-dependent epimerase/dehydratase domain-containing protein n=1 Tax=Rhodobium orientis TaxID=34017 RepID=A0A327JPC1_9HYPH|nr:NAD-dependent epimerase/dehydratase family protein [Rhodobium orientis]MBB4305394.1 dTDP-4-dehydrorhamnose reductase/UDP-glucose 4-epimerase [Rhodobium orientis]MBK5950072.1 hypothetical protein [Rhodobium orientis]RAI25258.1 hypothetical protein CH339_19130 [Rhodobium orientis]
MSIVLVGRNGFIGRAIAAASPGWRSLSHDDVLADPGVLSGADVVVNAALDPAMKTEGYSEDRDFDRTIASIIAKSDTRMVMLSSRKACGPSLHGGVIFEDDACAPTSPYGAAKLAAERAALDVLGGRLTVLRLSNIFGTEFLPGRGGFFGLALFALRRDGRMVLDMSPAVQRDFLPVGLYAEMIIRIAENPQCGVSNLGAGFGTPTGSIAEWLAEGFGGGELLVTDLHPFDTFWLDMTRTRAAFDLPEVTPGDIREACLAAGAAAAAV